MTRSKDQWIGTPFRRVDGRAKVTGTTRFADDLAFPRMCWARLVRSTVPHAEIRNIDFSRAARQTGFLDGITGEEMPETFGILPVSQDEHALCVDRVRFVGDPEYGELLYAEFTAVTDWHYDAPVHYELFNMSVDPHQLKNVYAAAPRALKRQLQKRLLRQWGCAANTSNPCP